MFLIVRSAHKLFPQVSCVTPVSLSLSPSFRSIVLSVTLPICVLLHTFSLMEICGLIRSVLAPVIGMRGCVCDVFHGACSRNDSDGAQLTKAPACACEKRGKSRHQSICSSVLVIKQVWVMVDVQFVGRLACSCDRKGEKHCDHTIMIV